MPSVMSVQWSPVGGYRFAGVPGHHQDEDHYVREFFDDRLAVFTQNTDSRGKSCVGTYNDRPFNLRVGPDVPGFQVNGLFSGKKITNVKVHDEDFGPPVIGDYGTCRLRTGFQLRRDYGVSIQHESSLSPDQKDFIRLLALFYQLGYGKKEATV